MAAENRFDSYFAQKLGLQKFAIIFDANHKKINHVLLVRRLPQF
jgi:hypothetical protein